MTALESASLSKRNVLSQIKARRYAMLAAAVLGAMSSTASAALNIYEPFNYTSGLDLQGQVNASAGTTANGNVWQRAGVANPPSVIDVASGSLTGPLELVPAAGNSSTINGIGNNSGSTNRLALDQNYTSGTVYYSFLLRVDALTGSNNGIGGFFLSMNNSADVSQATNPAVTPGKMQARIDPTVGTKFSLGNFTNRTAGAADTNWFDGLNVGQTYFIVGAIDVTATTNNVAKLWVDPNPATFGTNAVPTADRTDATASTISTGIQSILLRQSPSPFLTLDELRVGGSWSDVTPILSSYWDTNAATAGAGGATPTGTWSAAATNWSPSSTGESGTTGWLGAAYKAVFAAGTDATGAYTVTVSGTQSATALSFEEGTVTLTGGTVNLSAGNIDTAAGATANIGSGITGSSGLTKSGAGTVVLTGSMGYTGATTINAGTLQIGDGGTAGALPTSSAITNNGTLVFNQTDTVTQGTDFSAMSGTGHLTQAGSGNLILNVPNTFTGITKATAGTITVTDSLGLQNSTVDTTGAGSIIFDNALTSASVGGLEGATAYTANSAMSITVGNNARNASYSAAITGTGSLTKVGSIAQELTGVNNYSGGTNVNAGVLQFGATNSMPATGAVAVNSGGTLSVRVTATAGDWTNATSGVGTLGGLIDGDGGQTASQVTWNDGSSLGVHTNGTNVTYGGNIGLFNGTPDASKSVGLMKRGQGALTLTGTNTFRGQLRIDNDGGQVLLTTVLANAGQSMTVPTVNIGNAGGDATVTDGSRDTGVKILVNDALPSNSLISFGSSVAGTNAPSSLLQLYDGFAPNGSPPSGSSFNQTIRGLTGGVGRAKLGMGTLTIDVPATESYTSSTVLRTDYQNASVHGKIIKTGLGRQDFGGGNADYNGDFILQQGTLGVAAANVFGVSGSTTNRLIINGGTLMNASGNSLTISVKRVEFGGSFSVDPVTANNMQFQDATFTLTTANPTITVLPGTGGQFIAWGKITDNGAGYGFTKAGAGTLNLTASGIAGANDYSGATTIQAGALRVIEFSQIGNGTSDVNLSGGKLEYNGSGVTNGRLFNVTNPVHVTADSSIAYNSTTAGLTDVTDPIGIVFEFSNNTFDRSGGTLTFQHQGTSQGITFRPRFSGSGFDFAGAVVISNGGGTRKTVLESTNASGTQTWSGDMTGDGSYLRAAGGTTVLGGQTISVNIANASSIIFDRATASAYSGIMSGAGSVTKQGAGTLTVSGTNNYSGVTNINAGTLSVGSSANLGNASATNDIVFDGGTLLTTGAISSAARDITVNAGGGTINTNGFNSTFGSIDGAGDLTKTGAGELLTPRVRVDDLAVNGGRLKMTQQAGPEAGSGTTNNHVSSLSMTGGSTIDLTNNNLIIAAADATQAAIKYAAAEPLVISGFGNFDWLGTGITSSTAAAAAQIDGSRAVGIIDNTFWGHSDVEGDPVGPNDIIVKYTWVADANVDGLVDNDDFGQFLFGFNQPNPQIWLNGDFDYNGVVDNDDFGWFLTGLAAFNASGNVQLSDSFKAELAAFASEQGIPLVLNPVPEPTTLGILGLAGAGMLSRRRRRL